VRIVFVCASFGFALVLAGCGSNSTMPPPPPPPPPKQMVPKFAYVTNYGTLTGQPYTVSGFAVDATKGGLTPIAGSPFDSGQAPNSIAP
jgi:hypothetical protein